MSLLLVWSLRTSGVIFVAFALCFALRRRSASARNLVLRVALAVAWVLPLAVLVVPRVEIPLPRAVPPPIAPSMPSAISSPTPITEGWSVMQPDPSDSDSIGLMSQTPFRTGWIPAAHPFLIVWSLGAGFLALRWFSGLARLRRLRRAAAPTEAPDVWRAKIAVPMTYGRTILMPLEADVWPEARVRAAILHERAHIRRKDWAWQNIAALFAAVHWFNPLAWLLARLLRDAAETAADDAVLAQGVRPSDYARELLAVASGAGPTGPALAMARRGGVKDRVTAILNDRDRNGPSRRLAGALLALLAIAGLAAAGVTTDHAQGEDLPMTREEPVLVAGRPLRLLGIWEIGPKSARSWAADGSPASKELAAMSDRIDDFERKTNANKRNIKFVFDLPLVSPDSPGIVLRETPILDGLISSVRKGFKSQKGIVYTFLCEVAKDSPDRTDVRLGIADGKWHTIPVPKDRYLVRLTPKYHSGSRDARKEVEVDAQIPNTTPKGQYRLAAFDAKGRRLEKSGYLTTNDDRAAAGFYAPRGIARVIFEARPYRDVVFRDVSLRPVDRPAPVARLIGIVDRKGTRWDALGNPLPKDAAPAEDMAKAGYPTEPGVRQVRLDFSLASAPLGTSIAFGVPPPVETRVSGVDPKTGRRFINLAVPPGIPSSNIRVGIAEGAWQTYPNGNALRRTARPNANFAAAYNLEVSLPTALRGQELRLRLRNRDGSIPEPLMTGSSAEAAITLVKGRPEDLASVDLEHRPYRWSLLQDVRLAPKGERIVAQPWGPFRIGERSVRLIGVTEEGAVPSRIWRPDGKITTDQRLTPPGSTFVGKDSKLYRFAVEVQGSPPTDPDVRVGVHPEGLVEAWGMRDNPSWTETPNTIGRTYWPAVASNQLGLMGDVQVELRLGPWRTLAETGKEVAGPLKVEIGQTTQTPNRDSWTRIYVHLSGAQPPADQALELAGLDAKGKRLAVIDGFHLIDGRWNSGVVISHPERVVRWTLRSRQAYRVRFQNVRFAPEG